MAGGHWRTIGEGTGQAGARGFVVKPITFSQHRECHRPDLLYTGGELSRLTHTPAMLAPRTNAVIGRQSPCRALRLLRDGL
jgi:hypothetical protein